MEENVYQIRNIIPCVSLSRIRRLGATTPQAIRGEAQCSDSAANWKIGKYYANTGIQFTTEVRYENVSIP